MEKRVQRPILTAVLSVVLCIVATIAVFVFGRAGMARPQAEYESPIAVYVINDSGVTNTAGYTEAAATATTPLTYRYRDAAAGWAAAIAKAMQAESTSCYVTVRLADNWTADYDGASMSFGEGEAFVNGAINVPGGANILLDLSGKTIDRALGDFLIPVENGNVINVEGMLGIVDSDTAGNGVITGGYTAGNGGGITVTGMLELMGGSIENNAAVGNGGGVYAVGGAVILNGCSITNNTSASNGGGVYAEQSMLVINGGEIVNNTVKPVADDVVDITEKRGGGIYMNASQLEMTNGDIINNQVRADAGKAFGGGIYAYASTLTLTDGNIDQNTAFAKGADIRGGGIYAAAQSEVTFAGGVTVNQNNCVSQSGDAVMYGGGLYADSSTVSMSERATVSDNALVDGEANIGANSAGGGVAVSGSVFTVEGGAISGNSAHGASAVALIGSGTTLKLTGGTISGNQATEGGAVQWANGARVQLEGNPVVKDNTIDNDVASNLVVTGSMAVVGRLTDGAELHYTATADVSVIATGFANYNSNWVVGVVGDYTLVQNPANYFTADDGKYVVSSTEGVAVVNSEVTFAYAYSAGEETLTPLTAAYGVDGIGYIKGYSFKYEINGIPGEEITTAGVHTIDAEVDGVTVQYTVVINPANANDATVELDSEVYNYAQGTAIEPSATVKLSGVVIEESNYTIAYSSNTAVGTATVTVTFKGNYRGTVTKQFEIVNNGTDEVVQIIWEYNTSAAQSEWVDGSTYWFELKAGQKFTFALDDDLKAVDQGKRIRAKLTTRENNEEYIYSYVTPTSNQTLEFNNGGRGAVGFVNAGTYSVALSDGGNYAISNNATGKTLEGIVIDPMALELKSSDYAEYEDESGNRLWQLVFDSGNPASPVTTSRLMDGADVSYLVYADGQYTPKNGSGDDSYARYRGNTELALALNDDYTVNGHSLGYWLSYVGAADITYTDVGMGNVAQYRENPIVTTAMVNFGNNFVLADGGHALVLTKYWYIVTIENMLRSFNGTSASNIEVVYGLKYPSLNSMRPEYGDTVYWTISGNDITPIVFAVKFVPDPADTSINNARVLERFYSASVDAQGNYVLGAAVDSVTFGSYLERLNAGTYSLDGYVPEYNVPAGTVTLPQWWTSGSEDDEVLNDGRTVFAAVRQNFTVTVEPYSFGNTEFTFEVLPQIYSGRAITLGEDDITATYADAAFGGELRELVLGEDFTVSYSNNVNVTTDAVATFTGKGNFTGEAYANFIILQAENSWVVTPNIVRWTYGNFDKSVNAIDAQPRFLEDPDDMWFKITLDLAGNTAYEGLEKFRIAADGTVADEIADIFNGMIAGVRYYMFAYVESSDNYSALSSGVTGMAFQVFRAVNYWETRPTIKSWTEGKFSAADNMPLVEAHYGNDTVEVYVTDAKNNKYYDSTTGLNKLSSLAPGRYTLTAYVAGTSNYFELDTYSFTFDVFKTPGMPWWGTLLIVLGALLIAALVILVLWKVGVFTILTDKVVIAIRSKASIDATLASVRAAKRAEESRRLVEEAKRRDAAAARAEARKAEKELPEEERAAALEAKAQQAAERMEKMRAKVEAMQQRAERMRENARKRAEAEAMDAAAESAIEVEVEAPTAETPKTEEPQAEAEAPAEAPKPKKKKSTPKAKAPKAEAEEETEAAATETTEIPTEE